MDEVTGEKNVKCQECLLRSQAIRIVTPASTSSAVSTQSRYSPVSSQAWQEDGISRMESVVRLEDRNVETKEFATELESFLSNISQIMNTEPSIKKLLKWLIPLSNGQRKMNSRQRRKKKRADERNASESSAAPDKPPELPVIKTAFNRERKQ